MLIRAYWSDTTTKPLPGSLTGATGLAHGAEATRSQGASGRFQAETETVQIGDFDLDVVVQLKLGWVWTQTHIVHFSFALVSNPGFDEILGEHSTFEKVIMVSF